MEAYQTGEEFMVHFDLPGVHPSAIELNVQHNMLTGPPEAGPVADEQAETVVAERAGAGNAAHVTRPADIRGAVRRGGRAVGLCSSRSSSAGEVVVGERPGRASGV